MQINLSEKQKSSFWKRVEKTDTCWIWRGASVRGYGRFIIIPAVGTGSHRVSWAIHNGGTIPDNMVIAHQCDNPSCVNPQHLFLATQTENVADKVKKGRGYVRLQACNAKLTLEQIIEIRDSYKPRILTQTMLAKKFDVTRENIHYILKGKSWSHIPDKIPRKDERRKLTKTDISQIKSIYKSGKYSSRKLAKIFGVGKSHILRLIHEQS